LEGKKISDLRELDTEIERIKGTFIRSKYASLLFRGHANSNWELSTTLERANCKGMFLSEYYVRMTRVLPSVETFTGVNWNVPDYSDRMRESFLEYEEFDRFPSASIYRYMVYLRHYGFPSPLLDWSRSLYVAVFFAFREPRPEAGYRSVYVFCEMPEGYKTGASDRPRIRGIGPYTRGDARHFRQQSDYTMCGNFDSEKGWHFHPHEDVLSKRRTAEDFLWKFDLPSSKRTDILRRLNDFNLNAFSLFDSQESLLETMWLKEHVLRLPRL